MNAIRYCLFFLALILLFGLASAQAPLAAFTGTPLKGPSPLTVNFTDNSTGSPTGWAWFFGDETYTEPWTEMTASAGWLPRTEFSSVAMPDGSIVLMGGFGASDFKNDVWRSTDDGATWTEMTASAEWPVRQDFSSVAMPDGSIVLMGGVGETSAPSTIRGFNDVWRSTDDGATWTEMTASAGWLPRTEFSSVAMPDGSIVLMGGVGGTSAPSTIHGFNDVWRLQPVGSSAQNPSHTYTKPGRFQVALQAYNANGYNSMQKAGYINVTGALTVTGVSPISGSPSGDTPVIITGTGFTDVTGVFFDNIPAKSFVVNGDTEIDAVAPPVPPGAGSSGIVDVTVANSAGSSDIYHADEYQYTPYISGVSPVSGSINGGNTVTITGHNFKDATGVYFSLTGYSSDGIAATQYTIINDNTISAVVPNFGISRNYDVLVTNAAGENYNSPVVTYNTLPVVTEISPNSGPTGGGNTVTITGIGLEDGDAVSFGDKVSPNINVIHGVITAVVPPGSAGTVDVRVMDSWSKLYSPISQPADQYTYTSASSTTSVPSDGIVPTLTTVEADVQTGSSPSVPSTIDIPAQTTVTLPAGATNQISVASASVTPSSNPSETTFSVVPGLAVDADPSGTTFSNPVTISFTVTPAEYASVLTQAGDNPSGITIKYQEPGSTTWTTLQTTVTASGTNYVISAQTIRFCTFAVFSAPVSGGAGSSINAESGSGSSGPSSLDITSPGGTAGQTVTFAIGQSLSGNANYAIETVSIVSSQTLGSTDLTVSDATLVTTPPGNGRITDGVVAIEPVSVNPSAITSGTISFAVSGTWLSQHGLTPQNIVMMRNDGSGWTELPTTFVGQNGNAYTFTATTPGFSYFAITTRLNATAVNATATMSPKVNMTQTYAPAVPTGRIPAPTMSAVSIPTAAPEVTRTTAVPAVTGAGSGSSLPVLIIAGVAGIVVVIGGALLVRRWWIRRQNPALFRDYD